MGLIMYPDRNITLLSYVNSDFGGLFGCLKILKIQNQTDQGMVIWFTLNNCTLMPILMFRKYKNLVIFSVSSNNACNYHSRNFKLNVL